MTQRQLNGSIDRLLRDFKRRIEAAGDNTKKTRALRDHLRDTHGLVFVNAKPYFRHMPTTRAQAERMKSLVNRVHH